LVLALELIQQEPSVRGFTHHQLCALLQTQRCKDVVCARPACPSDSSIDCGYSPAPEFIERSRDIRRTNAMGETQFQAFRILFLKDKVVKNATFLGGGVWDAFELAL
jgi:hypothetical protein